MMITRKIVILSLLSVLLFLVNPAPSIAEHSPEHTAELVVSFDETATTVSPSNGKGAAKGCATGAAIGTAFAPGAGTLAGCIIAGIWGWLW